MYPSGFACPALLDVWVGLVSPLLFPSVYFALDRSVSGCGGVCRLFSCCCIWFVFSPLFSALGCVFLPVSRVRASGCFCAPVPVGVLFPLGLHLLAVPCTLLSASSVSPWVPA